MSSIFFCLYYFIWKLIFLIYLNIFSKHSFENLRRKFRDNLEKLRVDGGKICTFLKFEFLKNMLIKLYVITDSSVYILIHHWLRLSELVDESCWFWNQSCSSAKLCEGFVIFFESCNNTSYVPLERHLKGHSP